MAKRHLHSKDGTYRLFDDESEEYSEKLDSGEWFKSKAEADESEAIEEPEEVEAEVKQTETPKMLENSEFFAKTALLEVVGVFANGDIFAQNNGDDSDRWRIPKSVFESTYVKVEENSNNEENISDGDNDNDEDGEIDLETLSDDELRELAKESGIKSYHNMGREKLIAKLFELSAEEE